MSKNIYKYVGLGYLDKVIGSKDQVTLKCSHPKDFNDPYELFLTIDFKERPEALAFYADVVGNLPQLPTTCFSRSPAVIPMWAHYAQSLQGFAIEFDEALLEQSFPESGFGDIDYRDDPDEDLTDMLYRAYEIGKPRYLYFLREGVFSAAYYTKATCWSYEQERRMIVRQSETRHVDDLTLMDVPRKCVTALLCGPRASPETIRAVRDKASQLGCRYFELKIGRSFAVPFFVDSEGEAFVFNGTDIERSSRFCSSCKEPLAAESELCSWCQIGDSHKSEAAARNTYRMLDRYGLLEDYIARMDDISRGQAKRDA
jgi:hypothetical protein